MKESFKKRLTRYIEKTLVTSDNVAKETQLDVGVEPVETGKDSTGGRKKRIEELRSRLEKITKNRKKPEEPKAPLHVDHMDEILEEGEIPGSMILTDFGDIWEHETRIDLKDRYGSIFLLDALSFNSEAASLLGMDKSYLDFDPRRAVFLDTETTGLDIATATIPFLIGVGFIKGEQFLLKQIFIDSIEKEPKILEYLSALFENHDQFVTFNGKTYDIPLLKTRYIFNRMDTNLEKRLNLDLLHVVRRIYKRRIKECSLVSCERQVLGFLRENDIPGEMIPQIYVSFLRNRRAGLMPLVFHHNVQDIVSMVALLGSLSLLMESTPDDYDSHSPDDLLSMARLGIKRGRRLQTEKIWDYTSDSCEGNRKVESLVGLAKLSRRRQDYISARRLLELALEEEPHSVQIHLMLSKICEHDIQEYKRALYHAGNACGAEDEEKWHRRIKRIERKIEKAKK